MLYERGRTTPLVVIQLRVTRLRLLERRGGGRGGVGEKERCDLVCVVPVDDWANASLR